MHKYIIFTKITPILVLVLVAIFFFISCFVSGITLTEKNNGDSLNLKVGDEIIVKLESNPTTGYCWNISDKTNQDIVSLQSTEFKQSAKIRFLQLFGLVGAGGYEVLTFKALSKGSTAIILAYNRPWEEEEEPLNIYRVNIIVE